MKVLALISGGKDSCLSLLMCQRYGHEARRARAAAQPPARAHAAVSSPHTLP
jgi:diphthamide synthase (EF-2-diphthine--ammonia ligase)